MTGKRILIIDDDRNIRNTVRIALEGIEDWIPETASDGEEGLELLKLGVFRLALLDLKMPILDGMEVLSRVRRYCPSLPVIIITAYGSVETSVKALKLGAVDFLQKPFTPDQVRNVVKEALERQQSERIPLPKDHSGFVSRGKWLVQERRFTEARECLQNAVALKPSDHETLNLLGALSEIEGKIDEAQGFYRASLAFSSGYQPARVNLERVTMGGGAVSPTAGEKSPSQAKKK